MATATVTVTVRVRGLWAVRLATLLTPALGRALPPRALVALLNALLWFVVIERRDGQGWRELRRRPAVAEWVPPCPS